jgi:hypothetical protein
MGAPAPSSIALPDDSGNTGKKVRTQSRLVGADVVHEHFFVPSAGLTITGHYFFSSAQQTVAAALQNGTTTGFLWLQNPAASTITARLSRIAADCNAGSNDTWTCFNHGGYGTADADAALEYVARLWGAWGTRRPR